MGIDKWVEVSRRVTKAHVKYMFNFKEGPKRNMLKVQYFECPEISHHLYGRFLASYNKLPCNDEVPHYFTKLFYAKLFLGMKPYYNDLLSEFYGTGSGRTFERKGELRDTELPCPAPPLVHQPPCMVALQPDMDSTSHISLEARDTIRDNIKMTYTGINVGLLYYSTTPIY